jgi:hypothetical protein
VTSWLQIEDLLNATAGENVMAAYHAFLKTQPQ